MPRNPLLAKIHIAKKDLQLDDDVYRAVLMRVTGKTSSAKLSDAAKTKVLREFQRMGWKPKPTQRKRSSKPFVRKIFALWGELKKVGIWREQDVASLRVFVEKTTGVADPEWLTWKQARGVIEALKNMKERGHG